MNREKSNSGIGLDLLANKDSAITLWRGSSYNFVVDSSITQNPLYIASQDSTNWIKGAYQHEYTTLSAINNDLKEEEYWEKEEEYVLG